MGFDYTLTNDAKVELFQLENRGTFQADKRLQHCGIIRFVADGHLGRLTRNLRLLGFDVAYRKNADDRQLLEIMARENRALLTRDRRLLSMESFRTDTARAPKMPTNKRSKLSAGLIFRN